MRAQPERSGEGIVLPHDHPEILREHHVIRHITERDLYTDQAIGQTRIASGAYSESSEGGMSVDIEEWMLEDGLESTHYIYRRPSRRCCPFERGQTSGVRVYGGLGPPSAKPSPRSRLGNRERLEAETANIKIGDGHP